MSGQPVRLPATECGQVSMCRSPERVTFRVQGRVTMRESPPLRRVGEECLARDRSGLRIDLCQCTYMDSTFLGTLLYLKRAADRLAGGEFALVAPSPQCTQLLRQLGLVEVLPVETSSPPTEGDWLELRADSAEPGGPRSFQRHVVEAHQELAATPGKAGQVFSGIARGLTKELEQQQS